MQEYREIDIFMHKYVKFAVYLSKVTTYHSLLHAQITQYIPPLSLSVHVNGLGSRIMGRCKPEVELQSNSAAITAEEMSRLGSRLSTSRLHLKHDLVSIAPHF